MESSPPRLRKVVAEEEPSDSFLITFTSLSVMLLSFFVYLNAIAVPDIRRERRVVKSVAAEFNSATTGMKLLAGKRERAQRDMPIPELGLNFPGLTFGASAGSEPGVAASETPGLVRRSDRTVITIPSESLFQSGDTTIKAEYLPMLDGIAQRLLQYDLSIEIYGHTDDRPIRSERFPSNWDLSAARAAAVLRVFIDRGVPQDRLAAGGRAEFRPVASNDTEEGRALNRRVELVIKQSVAEP